MRAVSAARQERAVLEVELEPALELEPEELEPEAAPEELEPEVVPEGSEAAPEPGRTARPIPRKAAMW